MLEQFRYGSEHKKWLRSGSVGRSFREDRRTLLAEGAHFWTIRDGKIGRLQQTGDTLLIAKALGK